MAPYSIAYVEELERQITELEHHAQFDIPRRPVLERRWSTVASRESRLIFFDLDGLNKLNATYGYTEVNRRIAATFAALRADVRADTQVYHLQGGDEFLALCPAGDAEGLVCRIQALLWSNGLSASFAIVPIDGCLEATVEAATKRLKQAGRGARGKGRRGIIVLEDGSVIGPPAPKSIWQAFWSR
jgi:GGDEF domain-containing protein